MKARVALPAVVALGALAWVGTRGLPAALSYYVTPTELVHGSTSYVGRSVRVGGYVVPGSMRTDGGVVRFSLTDGTTTIPVVESAGVPPLFREGSGAIAEGTLGDDGVFQSEDVLVKHDEVYRVPTSVPSGTSP
jgi:cytochrome c-type biogenesis protein CcmE